MKNALDNLVLGRNYNLFCSENLLSEFKRSKDKALVAIYLGEKNESHYMFRVGDIRLDVPMGQYRKGGEDVFVDHIEII